ncbi:MAG TPA: lamin tail domain-containing protein [Pyrinomonadaceae bacterium]
MNKRTPYQSPFKGSTRGIVSRVFTFALSAMMLVQGFALATPVSGQSRARAVPPPAQQAMRQHTPQQRDITVGQPVNMRNLAASRTLAPSTAGRVELKPIHPPMGNLQAGRRGVAINTSGLSAPQTASQAPVPSVTGQSPPVTTSFKSDDLRLGSIPPDTMGAVGDTQIMTTTNEKIIVHDRKGVVLSNVTLDDFWATVLLGGNPPNTFDPKVLYDRFNDRWIIVTSANAQTATSATLVAVSQTNDALGTWNRYAIDADAAAVAAGGKWADYPSIGFNNNWISVQVNLFGFGTVSGYQGPAVYVINKAAAYANTLSTVSTFEGSFATCLASATQNVELGCGFTMTPAITEDNTTSTLYLAEDWDSTAAQLRLSKLTGTPAAPVLTVGTQFPQSANSWRFDAPIIGTSGGYLLQRQQNIYALSGNRVTANDSRIQNAVLRNGTLWATHHVMLPTVPTAAGAPASTVANPDNHTAVQWWEIDPTIETGASQAPLQRGRIEDPTATNCHNGSGGTVAACTPQGQFFAYANIAVNAAEDALIGYSRFSHLTLPKTAYSMRKGTDAVNTMRDSQTFREGVGNYNIGAGSPFNIRFGDYSATMVDPLNDTDFWTIQEYADFQREIFGPGQFAGVWSTWWALIKPTTTTTTAGNLIISEFRLRGPAGPRDEYVELYNPASTPLTVTTTDGSDGWAVAFSANGTTITALAAIPNGTTIPARGHYLVENNVAAAGIAPYSLEGYPNVLGAGIPAGSPVRPSDGDAMYTPDLADNGGVAIFRTGNAANMNAGARMDSVGFAGIAAGLFKEGTGIPNITGTPTGQITFARRQQDGAPNPTPGRPQDTNDNAADFQFLNPVNETLGVQPTLGAPGPENLDSPVYTGNVFIDRFDVAFGDTVAPNRVRKGCVVPPLAEECNPARSNLGTMSFRRKVTNFTGAPVSRLRFRIKDITTLPVPPASGLADLRAITSVDIVVNGQTVKGTTLEESTAPTQALGGGYNASWSVALPTPLAAGATINVQFLLGVQTNGNYRVFINAESLP